MFPLVFLIWSKSQILFLRICHFDIFVTSTRFLCLDASSPCFSLPWILSSRRGSKNSVWQYWVWPAWFQQQILYLEGLNHPFLTFLTSQVFLTYCQLWSECRVYKEKEIIFHFSASIAESRNALQEKKKGRVFYVKIILLCLTFYSMFSKGLRWVSATLKRGCFLPGDSSFVLP